MQPNPTWQAHGERVGRLIGVVLVVLAGGRSALRRRLLLRRYQVRERRHLDIRYPQRRHLRWCSALLIRQGIASGSHDLHASLYQPLPRPEMAGPFQLHLERVLSSLNDIRGDEALLRWAPIRHRAARLRRWASVSAGAAVPLVFVVRTGMLAGAALVTLILTGAGHLVVFLADQHRLGMRARATYAQATALIGGPGNLPAWAHHLRYDQVMLPDASHGHDELRTTFGAATGYDTWLADRQLTSDELDVVDRLAVEYEGTIASLVTAAGVLAR